MLKLELGDPKGHKISRKGSGMGEGLSVVFYGAIISQDLARYQEYIREKKQTKILLLWTLYFNKMY